MSTAFPQDDFLGPNGKVAHSWRRLLQNIWTATSQGASTLLVPITRKVNGHALTADVSVTSSDVGLGNVTNDAQTKAAIVPNTAPSAGQILIGNAGGTAYAPQGVSGDASLSAAGALTVSKIGGKTVNLAGSLTTAGAFASTFTMTGTTNVTFPVSGTLAAVAGSMGSVGTVTQATSKTTAVALNAVTGWITTSNSALAAGAVATFTLNNTSIQSGDIVHPQLVSGAATPASYRIWTENASTGAVLFNIENRTAGSLSEALVIAYAVIHTVTA